MVWDLTPGASLQGRRMIIEGVLELFSNFRKTTAAFGARLWSGKFPVIPDSPILKSRTMNVIDQFELTPFSK